MVIPTTKIHKLFIKVDPSPSTTFHSFLFFVKLVVNQKCMTSENVENVNQSIFYFFVSNLFRFFNFVHFGENERKASVSFLATSVAVVVVVVVVRVAVIAVVVVVVVIIVVVIIVVVFVIVAVIVSLAIVIVVAVVVIIVVAVVVIVIVLVFF